MRLPQFLKEVDEITGSMEQEELTAFVHEMARTLDEGRREGFLDMLNRYYGEADKSDDEEPVTPQDDGQANTVNKIESIIVELEEINEGEKHLDSEYNEEWDDWYNSDEEEVLFSDPDNLLVTVSEAITLIHKCVDMNLIEEGCRLVETVCYLEVYAEGDYNDYDGSTLGIEKLYEHKLLYGNIEDCLKECLYLTYLGNDLHERAENIYLLFDRFRNHRVRLEDILQMGDRELPEFDDFLSLWIDYLGAKQGYCAKRLLEEAQSMVQDDFALLENARKFVEVHPELYLQLMGMRENSGGDVKMLEIGLEALDKISPELMLRSEIALKTAEYADKLCQFDVSEKCWIEALKSNTNVINYMRVKFLTRNPDHYKDEVLTIIKDRFEESKKYNRLFRFESMYEDRNVLDKNDYCVMMFFAEKYDVVEKVGMSAREALGWSATFMKEGISFMLLLLFEGRNYPAGMKEMIRRAMNACSFKTEKLYKGTDEKTDKSNEALFVELFEGWKNKISLPEDLPAKWIMKIENLMEKRTTGIMEANRRNYYGECASFIAALGEVKESKGQVGEKNRILLHYKREYQRRRAFHDELRRYGMRE